METRKFDVIAHGASTACCTFIPNSTTFKNACVKRLRNGVAAGSVPGQERFSIFERHGRNGSLPGSLAGRDDVDVSRIKAEIRTAVVEQETGALHHHSAAESSIDTVRDADHVAPAIGNGEGRGLFAVGAQVADCSSRGGFAWFVVLDLMTGENRVDPSRIAGRRGAVRWHDPS